MIAVPFLAAGIDLGGTKIEAQVFASDWHVQSRRRVETPRTYTELVSVMAETVAWIDSHAPNLPIGVSSAGLINPATGLALTANLPATGHPFPADLQAATNRPIRFVNDCRALTLSEAVFGAAKNLSPAIGLILGTGLGGGLVHDGRLFAGDNSMAAEVWQFRHKLRPHTNAEEGASIRAVQRVYAEFAGRAIDPTLDPRAIFEIARGERTGNPYAALEAFRELGEVVGEVLGHALALVDGLVVIGGGMSAAWPLFADAMMIELNGSYTRPDGSRIRRLASVAFDLEDPGQLELFLAGDTHVMQIPGGSGTVSYDPLNRVGIGRSHLGTSEAVAVGAYAFALARLDEGGA